MQIGKSSLGNKHGTTANGTLRTPSDWVMTLKKLSGLKFSALPRECSRYVQCTPQTLTSLESLEPGAPLGHFTPSRVEFVRCPQNCRTCDCLSTDIHSHPQLYVATLPLRNQDLGMPLISCAHETIFCGTQCFGAQVGCAVGCGLAIFFNAEDLWR